MKAKKLFAALAAGVMLVCSAGCSKKEEKVKGSDGLSYYWSYYMDGEEIDYSQVNFDGTDTADSYMQYQLKGMAADDYCKKKLIDGECSVYTGILFMTAEKQSYSCEISVSTLNSEEEK